MGNTTEQWRPLVSIIIPVYNGANYLKKAIDCALRQTYSNIEVLVINDGSTDAGATEAIAQSYGNKIRYFYKKNGGVSSALNLGIREMRGKYFSWLSHDDEYTPDKIEKQIAQLALYRNEKVFSICHYSQIDKDSKHIGKKSCGPQFGDNEVVSWKKIIMYMFDCDCLNGCTLLIPKKAFEASGLFDEKMRFSQDFLMWLQILLCKYSAVICNEVLVYSRVHNAQQTQTHRELFRKDSQSIGELMIPRLTEISTDKDNFILHYARYNAVYGNTGVAQSCAEAMKQKKLITLIGRLRLQLQCFYGALIRPKIRKMYLRLVKHVVTQ